MPRFVYRVDAGDVEHGGTAASQVKAELRRLGVNEGLARRAGIIAFEGEMNLILYADEGGTLMVDVSPEMIEITLEDEGPGIEDIDLAMTPGFSTAPDWAIDLGFGAGMGLVNMQKNSDWFEIHSHRGKGTLVRCRLDRRKNDAP
jgi:anti-sigma regulatory factor (Ser/Thr protein kinase)